MTLASVIQLVAACVGIVGSLFFAIGIIRQNAAAMARLSYTYWESNPDMPAVLAAQKADYVFGGSFIVLAFAIQLASFFATDPKLLLTECSAASAPWVAIFGTIIAFLGFRLAAAQLAKLYQAEVEGVMQKQQEEREQNRKA